MRLIFLLLLFLSFESVSGFDVMRPDGVTDKRWNSLKAAVQEAKLLPTPAGFGGPNSQFGYSVAVDGDIALVGTPYMSTGGLVFVLQFDGSIWQNTTQIEPLDLQPNDHFGVSVSLLGSRALIGSSRNDDVGSDSGAAYIFEFDGSSWVQTAKLVADDAFSWENFGHSVSLSNDRALIGTDDFLGESYVFDYDGSVWSQSAKLVASDQASGDKFGTAVSLDGDRALIGAYGDDNISTDFGAAYVFDFDGSTWTETSKIVPLVNGLAYDQFGHSVSLSGDRVLIGAYRDDGAGQDSGSAYIYEFDGSNWNESIKLIPGDGETNDYFGYSVSLEGGRAVVGAYGGDDGVIESGATYVYDFDGSNWILSQKIVAADSEYNDSFGYAVSLSGNRIIVGNIHEDDLGGASGSVYVFDYDGSVWNESAKLTSEEVGAANGNFGYTVSLNGNRAAIGAYRDYELGIYAGAAYIYDYDGATWNLTAKLTASDGAGIDYFGCSVSLLDNRILIGAYRGDGIVNYAGAAYVFDYDGSNWNETTKLSASDGAGSDNFGWSVSLSQNRALIGANTDDDNGGASGTAYVFDFDGVQWTETTKLLPSDGFPNDYFGTSVSIDNDRALVSAESDDDNGESSGSAYVFDFDGSNWSQSAKLVASDGLEYHRFGASVSLKGNRVLIGALRANGMNTSSGAAYVFDFDGINWLQSTKLMANDGAQYDFFGSSVSFDESGDRVLVGAPQDDSLYMNSGSAYLFTFDGSSWSQSTKASANDSKSGDLFGSAVSMYGDRLLIGVPYDDDRGRDSGSAYLMQIIDTYRVYVNVVGLANGNTLVLQNNLSDDLAVTSNGIFGFSTELENGDGYAVTVYAQPQSPNQICDIIGGQNNDGTGIVLNEDVSDITVICTTIQYDVNVTVNGLATTNSVSLSNGMDVLDVSADGTQTISTLDDGSAFDVDITAQPDTPNQVCNFTNPDSGNLNGTNVEVMIECVTTQYNVNVTVSGLAATNTVSLSNGMDVLDVSVDGTQTISTLDDGSVFDVDITAQPDTPNQLCNFTNPDSGNLNGTDVEVMIECVTTQYNVNVTVNGLAATNTVSLSNGMDTLDVSIDGTQTISTLDDGIAFDVDITAQPDTPNQVCSFTNADSGVLNGADAAVTLECVTIQYDIYITVSGLADTNTVRFSNGMDSLDVSTDGTQIISTLDDGLAFDVDITTQPVSPNQICGFINADSGTVNGADVSINVQCNYELYTVGGIVTGLANGNFLVLQNTITRDKKLITNNGMFTFNIAVIDQISYSVVVLAQPESPNQTCTLVNPDGVIAGNDVTDIEVNCTTNQYFIGGTLGGLLRGNSVILQNNTDDDKELTTNGAFVFNTPLDDETTYSVTVNQNPISPIQTCDVELGSGTLTGDDVTDINIICEYMMSNDLIFRFGLENEPPNQ